jgi:hypothetical protein
LTGNFVDGGNRITNVITADAKITRGHLVDTQAVDLRDRTTRKQCGLCLCLGLDTR